MLFKRTAVFNFDNLLRALPLHTLSNRCTCMPSRRLCHSAIIYIVSVSSLFWIDPPAISRERGPGGIVNDLREQKLMTKMMTKMMTKTMTKTMTKIIAQVLSLVGLV